MTKRNTVSHPPKAGPTELGCRNLRAPIFDPLWKRIHFLESELHEAEIDRDIFKRWLKELFAENRVLPLEHVAPSADGKRE